MLQLGHSSAIVALAIGLGGCFTWRPYEPAAPLSESTKLPYRLRVTPRDTLAVSVAHIRRFERQRFNVWRTLGLSAAVPAAAVLALFAVFCAGTGCEGEQ